MTTLVWKTTIDERTCDECLALDGAKIDDLGFMPPLHLGDDSKVKIPCRCIVVEMPTAREMVTCVDFCAILRRQKIFDDFEEIPMVAINNVAAAMVSDEVRQKYLPPTGRLVEFGYLEKLEGDWYKLTGKDVEQKEFAYTEWVRLATTCGGE